MERVAPAEIAIEAAGAVWLAGCFGFSAWLLAPALSVSALAAGTAGAAIGLLGAGRLLQRYRTSGYALPAFEPAQVEYVAAEELLLTDEVLLLSDRVIPVARPDVLNEMVLGIEQRLGLECQQPEVAEELLVDDVLAEIGPGSRVIRLFDPAAMLTAGELQSRIDRHLQNREAPAYPDAAQALNDALADLRRSLR